MEWYYVCWPWLTAKRVEPVVSISWASCFSYKHTIRPSINQTISFVSCTDHKYRNMLSIWSSKHMVSRTDVPFGVTTFKFNIFPYFFWKKYVKIRAKIGNFTLKWWNMIVEVYQKVWNRCISKFNTMSMALNSIFLHNMMTS